MRKVTQERKDLSRPEQYRGTRKEGSPKPKTFTELALLRTEAKWNEGRKEEGGSPARKSPGKESPSSRTPVRLKVARIRVSTP